MVTAELTPPRGLLARARASAICTAALVAVTVAAAVAGALDRALASSVAPHPTLEPTLGAWGSILLTNTRVLALPALLAAFGFARGRWSRPLGDLAVAAVLGANAILVGLALGRWQTQLLSYVPQLPVEWLAAGTAAAIWVVARDQPGQRRITSALLLHTLAVLALLMAAAALEVFATPHALGTR
jgi:hypothetical protein